MGNGTITIGGITFKSSDVLNTSSRAGGTYNGETFFKYTVETKFGTFTFDDNAMMQRGRGGDDKPSSIYQSNGQVYVDNCNLNKLQGTDKSDNFVVNDSFIAMTDVKGDPYNTDTVTITGKTKLGFWKPDDSDKVIDLTTKDAPSEDINVKYKH